MTATPWVAPYATALAVWLVALLAGRQPTLWKGKSLAYLNGAFIAGVLAVMIAWREMPGIALYAFVALLFASAILARNAWLLLHVDRAGIDRILERCFAQTRSEFQKVNSGYNVTASGGTMSVGITRIGAIHGVRFAGTSNSRKGQLIRALIAKQFQPSFPALRIRT